MSSISVFAKVENQGCAYISEISKVDLDEKGVFVSPCGGELFFKKVSDFSSKYMKAGPKIKVVLGYVGSTGDTETNNGVAKITASSTKEIFGKTVHCNNFISAIYTEVNNDEVNKEFEFGHACL